MLVRAPLSLESESHLLNVKRHPESQERTRRMLAVVLVAASLFAMQSRGRAEEAETHPVPGKPAEQSPAAKSAPADKAARIVPRKLSGAELYSIHCNRCHPERYPTERTAAQWKTILLHMRVRANLPAEQARTILKYLQDNSGR
jgi:cytochrome c5